MNRDLLISLVFSGGSADVAYLHNSKYTIDEYVAALDSDDYKKFAEEVNKQFIENADLVILGNLYRLQQALVKIGPTDKNYPGILKAYNELLKLSAPIVERMQKVKIEASTFDGLELVIRGTECA